MKVLIVRVGAMGDVLHALPAVAALRRERPEWTIDWAVNPRWASVLIDNGGRGPVVNTIHPVPTNEWTRAPFSARTLRSVLGLRKALRAAKYDAVIDMQGTLRSAVIGRFAGAKKIAGYSDPRESLAATLYKSKLTRRGEHVVEQGAALLGEALGVSLTPGAVTLPPEEWADNWAAEVVGSRRLAVLAASAGWGAKRWPAEKFGKLAQGLAAMGFEVAVNAPRKDDALAAEVIAASEGAAKIVVCNVTGLIALLRRTSLLVGGDSGPVHLAAALGVPLVALYGPTRPERNGPWGPGPMRVLRDPASLTSYKRTEEVDPGLARIGVEAVLEAACEIV